MDPTLIVGLATAFAMLAVGIYTQWRGRKADQRQDARLGTETAIENWVSLTKALSGEVKRLTAEVQELRSQRDELLVKLADLHAEILELRAELQKTERLRERVAHLESLLEEKDNKIKHLKKVNGID